MNIRVTGNGYGVFEGEELVSDKDITKIAALNFIQSKVNPVEVEVPAEEGNKVDEDLKAALEAPATTTAFSIVEGKMVAVSQEDIDNAEAVEPTQEDINEVNSQLAALANSVNEEMLKDELLDIANVLNVDIKTNDTKAQLVEKIRAYKASTPDSEVATDDPQSEISSPDVVTDEAPAGEEVQAE